LFINHAFAGQLKSFVQRRALLVLHDHGKSWILQSNKSCWCIRRVTQHQYIVQYVPLVYYGNNMNNNFEHTQKDASSDGCSVGVVSVVGVLAYFSETSRTLWSRCKCTNETIYVVWFLISSPKQIKPYCCIQSFHISRNSIVSSIFVFCLFSSFYVRLR
jgi:hypothetical protein